MADINTLKQKFLNMRTELKVKKSKHSDFGNYDYRSLEDITEALKPLEQKYNVVVLIEDEIIEISSRYYVQATVMLIDIESDEKIMTKAYARECETKPKMDDSQATGSASSYARKYALSALFGLDDGVDSDSIADAEKRAEKAEENASKLTKEQKEITNMFNHYVKTTGTKEDFYKELKMEREIFINNYNNKPKDLLQQIKRCLQKNNEKKEEVS